MSWNTGEIRRQLAESARVKQAFSDALVTRIAEFAQRSAAAICLGNWIAHHLGEPEPSLAPEHGILLSPLELKDGAIKPMFERTQKGLDRVKGLLAM